MSVPEQMTAKKHPLVRELGVHDICWELAPAPWPKSPPVLELSLDALGIIEDDLARAVIAQLATTIVDQIEELAAVRSVLSASLAFSTAQFGEVTSACHRLAELREERRRLR